MKEKPWTLQGFYDLVYYELVNKEYTELKKKASTFIIIVEFIKKICKKRPTKAALCTLYMWALSKALHIGGREGQAAMNPVLHWLTSYLTDTASTARVLSQEIGIYKNK